MSSWGDGIAALGTALEESWGMSQKLQDQDSNVCFLHQPTLSLAGIIALTRATKWRSA